jgi:hypothetical protein
MRRTLLAANVLDGPTNNSTALTSLLDSLSKTSVSPNFFKVGDKLLIEAWGQTTLTITTPGTKKFTVRFGSVDVFASPAFALNTSGGTFNWRLSIVLTLFTVSGSPALWAWRGNCMFSSQAVIGSPSPSSGGSDNLFGPEGAQVDGTAYDNSVSQVIDLLETNTVASGDILHHYILEHISL